MSDENNDLVNFMKSQNPEESKSSGLGFDFSDKDKKDSDKNDKKDKKLDKKEEEKEKKKKEFEEAKKASAALASKYRSVMFEAHLRNLIKLLPFALFGIVFLLIIIFQGPKLLKKTIQIGFERAFNRQ